MRIGPSRLVVTVLAAMASSTAPAALSMCMMPALLIKTFSVGKSMVSWRPTAAMLAGSSTFSCTAHMPGLALVTSSSSVWRRPEMMTWLPNLCSASASARPMPEVPPVMKIVLPFSFMVFPWSEVEKLISLNRLVRYRSHYRRISTKTVCFKKNPVDAVQCAGGIFISAQSFRRPVRQPCRTGSRCSRLQYRRRNLDGRNRSAASCYGCVQAGPDLR